LALESNRQHDKVCLCAKVSQEHEIADAKVIFQEAKKIAPKKPLVAVNDGLLTHDEAFQKEFFILRTPRTMNVRSVSLGTRG
jgi:hypothetical protein